MAFIEIIKESFYTKDDSFLFCVCNTICTISN